MDKSVDTVNTNTAASKSGRSQPCIESKDLFVNSKELVIRHNDDEYHLRITRNDKLILTK